MTVWSGSTDESILVWSETEGCLRKCDGINSWVTALTVFKDHVWSGSKDGAVRQWSPQGLCLKVCTGHTDWVRCLVEHNDCLWSGSYDHHIRIWNQNGECLKEVTEQQGVPAVRDFGRGRPHTLYVV